MRNAREFCTCASLDCPLHPANHGEGCAPCIDKNLRLKEIPSCFFNLIGNEDAKKGYSFRDFAKMVLEKNSDQE